MQNMFKNKGMKTTYKQFMVQPKVANPLVHIMDVNMGITKCKVAKEHVFKDREPIKKKFVVDIWEEERRLQRSFVKIIQEMQTKDPLKNLNQKEKAQWNTSWVGLLEVEVSINQLYHKVCLLFLTTKLCLWNKCSKISINKCWKPPIF
jgi:hypothetical protein